jgi:hypothetical protein
MYELIKFDSGADFLTNRIGRNEQYKCSRSVLKVNKDIFHILPKVRRLIRQPDVLISTKDCLVQPKGEAADYFSQDTYSNIGFL